MANKMRCPVAKLCGGCAYSEIEYEEQLAKKQRYINGLLKQFGPVDNIIGMKDPCHYRNKVCAEFKRKKNGDVLPGRYQEKSHNVVEVKECLLEDQRADAIIRDVAGLFKSFKMNLYNEDKGTGLIRHVLVRTGRATGQVMVVIVTASPVFPSKKNFAKALVRLHPEITTIVQNINPRNTSFVVGNRNETLYGKGYIEDVLCGKKFRISPNSFYQVNPVQTETLYGRAIKYGDLKKKDVILDAYCGIGTIGIIAADKVGRVIGVELNGEAIKDAKINAKVNSAQNVEFYKNDAGRFMVEMAQAGEEVNVVFMDPPRSGSDEAFLSSVVKLSPKKVVYVSCGPESLARDLKYLTKNGYGVRKITPVDMFPFTEHVEVVALLSRSR